LSDERFLVAWTKHTIARHDEKFFNHAKFRRQIELAFQRNGGHIPLLNFELNFMADAANKYPESVAGKYYVDNQCIDCDLCRETAPDNFKRNDDGGYSFVYKQPATPDEEARCKEAKEGCPVEAIGDNGA
jgi:ferredoxin